MAGLKSLFSSPKSVASALGLVAVSVVLALASPRVFPFIGALENQVADIRVATLTPPEPQFDKIIVITITEDTLAGLAYRSPLDRRFLAGLIKTLDLTGVRAIGLDILFDQPTEPAKDAELKAVIEAARAPIVAAWAGKADQLTDRQIAYQNGYLRKSIRALPNLMTDSRDGVVRWIFPGRPSQAKGGKTVPGFAGALAAAIGVTYAPGDAQALAYRAGPDARTSPFKIFPAHTVKFLPKIWFKDKVVLIGADLPLSDRHRTPFSAVAARGGIEAKAPGVLIHAYGLAQIIEGRRAPGVGIEAEGGLALLFGFLGLILAALRWPVAVKAAAFIGVAVVLWGGGFWVFEAGGPLLPLVTPSITLVLAAGLGAAQLGRRERQRKKFIRKAFSRLISPGIVNQLIDSPDGLALAGTRREVTYIFTDIAGFTSLTEQTPADVVLPLLNSYIDGMCRIALEHEATIDKIVGDAVVCFFNAPVDQPDHPARAMACVRAMDAFTQSFAAGQQEKGIDFGITRFGVNTGTAVVGNFGGESFFDYTGHGDSVNTAARLESANKHFGTTVCVSGHTASHCPDIRFRPIGSVVLKGKKEGLDVFEPLSDEAAEAPGTVAYMAAFELMREGSPGALAAFEKLAEDYPDDTLAAMHLGRLGAGESGVVFTLTRK